MFRGESSAVKAFENELINVEGMTCQKGDATSQATTEFGACINVVVGCS